MTLFVHTDGGARGNPGPAAVGVVIANDTKIIHKFGKRIGETTNNVAEYTAVIEALHWIKEHPEVLPTGQKTIKFILDSTLVVNQLNGLFKVKDGRLRELLVGVRLLEESVGGNIVYKSVPREQNTSADLLVNAALDSE